MYLYINRNVLYVQMEASGMKQSNMLNTWITVVSVLCALWPSLLPTSNNQERRYHCMGTFKLRLFSQSSFLKMCPVSVAIIMVISNSSGLIYKLESSEWLSFQWHQGCSQISLTATDGLDYQYYDKQNCSICLYIMKTTLSENLTLELSPKFSQNWRCLTSLYSFNYFNKTRKL